MHPIHTPQSRRTFIGSAIYGAGSFVTAACFRRTGRERSITTPDGEGIMHTVTSRDGTRIAFWRSGEGPPLVLVHGVVADHSTTWQLVLPRLEQHFTVYAVDRRGRGGSGDTLPYDLQREAEDVAAVVDSIGGPAYVLGHSYGGLCAMEAALLNPCVRGLVLYEGVTLRGESVVAPGVTDRLEALLRSGDVEGMLVAFLRELAGASPDEIDLLRSQRDAWAARLRNAPTIPRELRALEQYELATRRLAHLRMPVLLLVGERSPAHELERARAVADLLTDARVSVLPGQQHLAMYTAPDLFVSEVVRFLEERGVARPWGSVPESSGARPYAPAAGAPGPASG